MLARPALVLAALAIACDPKPDEETEDDHHHAESSSEADTSDTNDASCAQETRDDTYELGLEKSGEHVTVRFVDAVPAPPARFDNMWMLEVVDATTNMPLVEVDLEVEPYMPDHMHGTSIACEVTAMPEPGQVKLEPVNLFMPGMWEVRLNFTLDEGLEDQVVFRFCVDP
jgi:hypothetical protein